MVKSDFGLALLMEPRTGKTKTCVDYFGVMHMKHGLNKVLVICPNRVMAVWVAEIHKNSPLLVDIILWDRQGRKKHPRIPELRSPYDIQVVIVNYEAFSTPGKKLPSGRRSKATGRFKFRSEIAKWVGDDNALCILDESHKIKSPSGKAALMIVSMRRIFCWRVIATGTAVTKANKAHDIYMQWKFLNEERFAHIGNADEFKHHYGKWVPQENYERWVGGRNLDDLHKKIHKDAFTVQREDCFDLPSREDIIEHVKIKGETARVYDEISERMFADLVDGEIVEANYPMILALRLGQITGGTANTSPPDVQTYRIGSEKLLALKPHLEDAVERSEKLVVAARFKADLNAIADLCDELSLPCWQLRGGVKRTDSDRFIQEFRKHDDAGVFLMQPSAGALGIDLSTSAKMIWYSLTPSYVDFTQACDRIALSRTSTTFIYLLAADTIDEVVYAALQNDGDVVKAIHSSPEKLLRSTKRQQILKGKSRAR